VFLVVDNVSYHTAKKVPKIICGFLGDPHLVYIAARQ
jgi:hypothetical protein